MLIIPRGRPAGPRQKPPTDWVLDRHNGITEGLILASLFNEGAGAVVRDLSGYDRPGVTAAPWVKVNSGFALHLIRASTHNVDFGATRFMNGLPQVTAISRQRITDFTAFDSIWGQKTNASHRNYCQQGAASGALLLGVSNGANRYSQWDGVVQFGVWQTIGMVFDGTNPTAADRVTLYIDGVDQGARDAGNALPATTSALLGGAFEVGHTPGEGGSWNDMEIEYLLIWNRVLNATEQRAVHARPDALFRPPGGKMFILPIAAGEPPAGVAPYYYHYMQRLAGEA